MDAKNISELKPNEDHQQEAQGSAGCNQFTHPIRSWSHRPCNKETAIESIGAARGQPSLQSTKSKAQGAPGIAVDSTDPHIAIDFRRNPLKAMRA